MAKTTDYLGQIQTLQKLSAATFVVLIIAAVALMSNTSYSLTMGYMVKDDVASQLTGSGLFAPALRTLFDVPIKWLLVSILALSAISAYLLATKWRRKFEQGVKDGIQPLRWLDFAITFALMLEVVALMSGVTDILVLKLMAGLVALACGLAWLSERQNTGERTPAKAPFILSLLSAALPFVLLIIMSINTFIFGMIRAPWYVYVLLVVVLAGLADILINHWLQLKKRKNWKEVGFVERNFAFVNFLTKFLFAAILVLGLKK